MLMLRGNQEDGTGIFYLFIYVRLQGTSSGQLHGLILNKHPPQLMANVYTPQYYLPTHKIIHKLVQYVQLHTLVNTRTTTNNSYNIFRSKDLSSSEILDKFN